MAQHQNLQAVLLALTASAILSFIDNFVAPVSEEAGLWQFQVIRALFALPILIVGARLLKLSIRPKSLKRTILRSVAVSTGLLIYFAALGFLPVAQAGAGLFSSPIWVLIFSVVLFGSRVTLWQIVAMALGFIGVLMLLQPDMDGLSGWSLFPLIAGAFYGLGMLITRHWCFEEPAVLLAIGVFTTMGLVSLVLLLVLTIWPVSSEPSDFIFRGWEPITSTFLWLTLGQAVGAVIAVSCISQAYRIGQPAMVAMFEYSFLVFAALWAYLLWQQTTNQLALVGIGIILVAGGLMTLNKSGGES